MRLVACGTSYELDNFDCNSPENEAAPTWKELEKTERSRREILKRVELPLWRILTYVSGTCLRSLALDWLIWVPIAIFIAIRIQARSGREMPNMVEQLGDTDIDILGGFLSFLLVLFVNQTNTRFFEMYKMAKKCAGLIQSVAGLASTQFSPAAALRIVRYMNAAQVAGYVGLGGPYSKKYFFDHINQKYNLLNEKEMAHIERLDMDAGSAVFKELITWCQHEVQRERKAGTIDSYEAAQLHNRILDLRGAMDGIYDYRDQPTHFFYIHFLCLLSALYLPLFAIDNAYPMGWGDEADWAIELLNFLIVLLQAIFVVGLRLLGQNLVDPFGEDLEDLSVITYAETTIENCRIIMASPQQPDVDDASEFQLAKKEQPLGQVV